MNTTVSGDVNRNSPHIGQSHSVFLSIQRWDPCSDIDIHTLQVCVLMLGVKGVTLQ
jgi:hypothetical protein